MADQPQPQKHYVRFGPTTRFEHVVLIVTFTGLALTGLPQKFADQPWANTMIDLMGGVESVRIIHRFLATLLMAETIFHGGILSYKIYVLGRRATMIPGLRDLRDVWQWMRYNLGWSDVHPELPRYNFGEKFEYLAVVWGTLIMIVTGFMLLNPVATTSFLPGEVIPAARAAHGAEALLAVLAVVTWHMYNVHIRRFNRSMFTGKISHEAMVEEHAEELHAINRGETQPYPPPEVIAARTRRFWPYAIIVTVLLIAGLAWFMTLEQSAITTVPRQEVAIFAPQMVTEEGDAALGAALWPTLRCARCHGDDAAGGPEGVPALRGLSVDADAFYQTVRAGGDGMPAFGPEEISDNHVLHVWAWLSTTPAAP